MTVANSMVFLLMNWMDRSVIYREGGKEGKRRKKAEEENLGRNTSWKETKMEESMTGLNRLLFLLNGVLHISPNVHSLI